MSEIKFRVKRKFYDLYDKYIETKWEYFDLINGTYLSECLMETLGQYIGLKDKNGVEIYDGDILSGLYSRKLTVVFGKLGYDGSWNGLTGFHFKENEGTTSIENDDCTINKVVEFMELSYGFNPLDIEVIGNIHDEATVNK